MNYIKMRGKKGTLHPNPDDPPRRRANKRRGRGTYANDRPPIVSVISRRTGEYRGWVVEHADGATSKDILVSTLPLPECVLYTDEATNYTSAPMEHHTVCHAIHEWARDDDGDGRREVHCNSCEGIGAALRTYLRPFRGVHKYFLAEYVATFETMFNAKSISPSVVQRMAFGDPLHSGDS
jgi:transposase-like protein